MKKFASAIFATVIAFISIFPLNTYALDFDSHQIKLEWSNAPKNTAYIDILIQMDTDDENYVDFTVPPKKLIEKYIDENGNVLGITDKSKKSYDMHEEYAVMADGNSVVFRIFGMSPFVEIILIALIYGVPVLLFSAVLYLLINKIRITLWR